MRPFDLEAEPVGLVPWCGVGREGLVKQAGWEGERGGGNQAGA